MHLQNTGRRSFLTRVAGSAVALAAAGAPDLGQATVPAERAAPGLQPVDVPQTLSPTEWAFISALADTMIPADELTASGTDLGIVLFIDRQLAGAYGTGARLYRSGPFVAGKAEQGYQSALTPREFIGAGIVAVNQRCTRDYGKEFDRLGESQRAAMLHQLEAGAVDLGGFAPQPLFDELHGLVMQGFFADPLYGGNRGKASWAMLGFPGLPALYREDMGQWRDRAFVHPPQSIADQS